MQDYTSVCPEVLAQKYPLSAPASRELAWYIDQTVLAKLFEQAIDLQVFYFDSNELFVFQSQ